MATRTTKTVKLSPWQLLALEVAVEQCSVIEAGGKRGLLELLAAAQAIVIKRDVV